MGAPQQGSISTSGFRRFLDPPAGGSPLYLELHSPQFSFTTRVQQQQGGSFPGLVHLDSHLVCLFIPSVRCLRPVHKVRVNYTLPNACNTTTSRRTASSAIVTWIQGANIVRGECGYFAMKFLQDGTLSGLRQRLVTKGTTQVAVLIDLSTGLKQAPRPGFRRFAAYLLTLDFTPRTLGTMSLQLFSSTTDSLIAYSDADWAGARLRERRRFPTGDGGTPVVDPTLYRSLAGSLQYLTFTRPDITYAVQQVCLYMHDPREPHFSALKRILRYVQGTLDYGLQLFSSTTDSLIAYSDADWAGCPTTRRSTSGYCVFLGNNLLSWSSKRQPTLSRSSAEAEYRGVANAVAETCWIRNLLRELHTPLSSATIVYCDNVSAVYLSSNPVQHQRTKHIEIDIHFVRDLVATGQVRVLHVPSRFQYADIFTKGLPSALFEEFRTSLSVRCPPAPTAGEC
ncbi:ribonuclease H-like domain-containing protein [Tanacetum coccineum]